MLHGVLEQVREGTERRACAVFGWCRAALRYRHRPRLRDERLKALLPGLAREAPREGYRRMRERVCALVEPISCKALQRLWRILQLQVKPRKRSRKRGKRLPVVTGLRATGPNHVWCMDFMKDWTLNGRAVRILSVVDEYTRECLALVVARRLTAADVVAVLEVLLWRHGTPAHVRSDNGPEFVATLVVQWAAQVGIELVRSAPASPWQNPFSESFHSRVRDELTEGNVFGSLEEAQVLCEAYRQWYNTERRHSALRYQTPAACAVQVRNLGSVPGQPGLAVAQA